MNQRSCRPRRRASRGRTLIEILIVVILIGMTAAFVAPRIDMTSYRINGGMQSIGTTLLAAQLSGTRRPTRRSIAGA